MRDQNSPGSTQPFSTLGKNPRKTRARILQKRRYGLGDRSIELGKHRKAWVISQALKTRTLRRTEL